MKKRKKIEYLHPAPTFPWRSRQPERPRIRKRWKEGSGRNVRLYVMYADGSVHRPEHPRHERKASGLSPRQYRRAKREIRETGETPRVKVAA